MSHLIRKSLNYLMYQQNHLILKILMSHLSLTYQQNRKIHLTRMNRLIHLNHLNHLILNYLNYLMYQQNHLIRMNH